jgi:hypothetical protein
LAGPWRIDSTDGQLVLTTVVDGRKKTTLLLDRRTEGAAAALGRELAAAQRSLLAGLGLPQRYGVVPSGDRWKVTVVDAGGQPIGTSDLRFPSKRAATGFIELMSTWAAHKRAIVVEHLLLRPKFPGDALYPACADGPGCGCGGEDPYSFRLTYVLPGWTAPFSTNMDMRGFADRTIQEQTPSHLLGKTCWVGNDGYLPDPCDPVLGKVAEMLPAVAGKAACACAEETYAVYGAAFQEWYGGNTLVRTPPDVLAATLAAVFAAKVDLADVSCATSIDAGARKALDMLLVEHFVEIAGRGYQFERFEDAWRAWAEADAKIDWTQERLQDTVLEVLGSDASIAGASPDELCTCATAILAAFGTQFREWMDANIAAGRPLAEFTVFTPSLPAACAELALPQGVSDAIEAFLMQRYSLYREVSYHLTALVQALAALRNTHPRATLHDCDAGSDLNPVRLGHTALGSN